MKINWGTGITIAIILFMGYILLMVFKATSTTQHLQAEDYYSQEIGYQTKIDALRLGDDFSKSVRFIQDSNGLELLMPEGFMTDHNKVDIYMFRPNDSALDLQYSIHINEPFIERKKLLTGTYKVTISWKKDNVDYALESEIKIK